MLARPDVIHALRQQHCRPPRPRRRPTPRARST
jgi:hypothetical protein